MRGLPFWAVLIGLEVDGEVVVGVTHMPAQNRMYHAVKGGGAFLNDKKISISGIDSRFERAGLHQRLEQRHGVSMVAIPAPWMDEFWAVRSVGGCMDAMLLASGHADLWLEAHAKAWDLGCIEGHSRRGRRPIL